MNVYATELRRLSKSFISWLAVMVLLLGLFMAFFPSMASSEMTEIVKAKLDAIPEGLRKAFGIDEYIDFSDVMQYFSYIAQYIMMAACIYASILGSSALIKEESEGTIEFLYAQPVSRAKILLAKLQSTLSILLLFNIIMYAASLILCGIFRKPGYDYIGLLTVVFTGMTAVQIVFLAIGLALSTVMARASQAVPVSLALFFTTFILGTFSSIISDLEWLKYISPFNYATPANIVKSGGNIETVYIILMAGIVAVSIAFSFLRYRSKDLRI